MSIAKEIALQVSASHTQNEVENFEKSKNFKFYLFIIYFKSTNISIVLSKEISSICSLLNLDWNNAKSNLIFLTENIDWQWSFFPPYRYNSKSNLILRLCNWVLVKRFTNQDNQKEFFHVIIYIFQMTLPVFAGKN